MRRAGSLAALVALAVLGWAPGARGVDPPPPFTFHAVAGSSPISGAFTLRGSPADPSPLVSSGVATTTANASSVPLAGARGSLIDPAPYSLVLLEVVRNSVPQAPGFPTMAAVATPGEHEAETPGAIDTASGGLRVRAGRGHARVDDSLQPQADAQVGEVVVSTLAIRDNTGRTLATAPGITASSARSATTLSFEGGLYRATTEAVVTGISIEGAVEIGMLRTAATVSGAPEAAWTRAASVTIADMRVAGMGVVIGPKGITVAGSDVPDVIRRALEAANEGLRPHGGTILYSGAGISGAPADDVAAFASGLTVVFGPTDPTTGEVTTTSQVLLGHSAAALSASGLELLSEPVPPPAVVDDFGDFDVATPPPPEEEDVAAPVASPTQVSGIAVNRVAKRVKSAGALALLMLWLCAAGFTTIAGARWALGGRR